MSETLLALMARFVRRFYRLRRFCQSEAERETIGALTPVGCILAWWPEPPPAGWLVCDGGCYARSTYPELYAILGGVYTSRDVDSQSFAVPDVRAWGTYIIKARSA